MKLTQHISNNGVLAAPPGMSHEECSAAPITRVIYDNNSMEVWTFWEPSAEEMRKLSDGKKVKLVVLGFTMPPVRVEVE